MTSNHEPVNPAAPRKGFARQADIPPEILQALSRGEIPSATLTEGLAIDQAVLASAVFPSLSPQALQLIEEACALGILKRMQAVAAVLTEHVGPTAFEVCRHHLSDTVRGWACFMVGQQPAQPLAQRLVAIEPLAADAHFGVREWAWMAIRPHLAVDVGHAIALLVPWTQADDANVRRFACESIRPRGVWCAHITVLKKQPEQALPILQALREDASVYVQDSVANWLNDAAKDRPEWVQQVCADWLRDSPSAQTQRICQRAQRSIKPAP